MENKVVVFVYAKDKQIKVLGLNDSLQQNERLLADDWKHTETLDICVWLEHLHNECSDVFDAVQSLSK